MNLQTIKPSYRSLPLEQRLRWLARIRTNRTYPTGRMCNYTSWKLLPAILEGDPNSEPLASNEADSLDTPLTPSEADPYLLPTSLAPEPSLVCGDPDL